MSSLNNSTCRPLRILIVDDNHINLSVLSTLLKRRFSHLMEGAPVSVDSGLKAIQLLRTHIFDCIFMDIQMPFLSGLEACRRIRDAEDGILPANSDAHIVAVTTAIGDEPELAYRRMRMDGMIGKPVRYNQLQKYLLPLSLEAYKAALTVPPINVDGESVMPPLPPASEYERVFYLPADAITPSNRPDICEGSDFETLLHSQTLASLRRFDSSTPACRNALESSPVHHDLSNTLVEETDCESSSTLSSRCNSSGNMEKMKQTSRPSTTPVSSPTSMHNRNASMTISKRTLSKQILREVANADLDNEVHDTGMPNRSIRSTTSPSRTALARPCVLTRNSSPGWLLSEDTSFDDSPTKARRPALSTLLSGQDQQSRSISAQSSESSGDSSSYHGLRRVSGTSSGSVSSDASSAVTTPACDSPLSFFCHSANQAFGFARDHERTLSNRTAHELSSDGVQYDLKDTWSASSDTATGTSSPARIKVSSPASADPTSSTPLQTISNDRGKGIRHYESLQELVSRIGQLDLAP